MFETLKKKKKIDVSITHETMQYYAEELEKSHIMWHLFKASMDCCCTYDAE
jgi:hypothetical protein